MQFVYAIFLEKTFRCDLECDAIASCNPCLLKNEECAKHFNDALFSILATAKSSFHLSVLEVTYINSLQPILCRQKEFVHS